LIQMCCMEYRSTHLSTWVSADLKDRFAAAAARQGLSESALLKRLVEQLLADAGEEFTAERPAPVARDARMTVRLVPDDSLLLRERAAARGMPAASYVSTLVRSHLRSLAPLPDRELEALRSAVTQLAAIGRNLNAMTRTALAGGTAAGPTQEHLRLMLRVSEAMRDHVKGLIHANVVSWEAGYAKTFD
jgi:predicted DNA binding CopG/RHH family protein